MGSQAERCRAGRCASPPSDTEAVVAAVQRASYNRPVRLVFGDIHMAFQALERLGPSRREADYVILTGDLTHVGDPPDAFRVIEAVRRFCPNVLALTGNLDFV